MVKAESPCFLPECSARKELNLNCMSIPLEPSHQECVPICTRMALAGFSVPMSSLKIEPKNEAHRLIQCLTPPFQTFVPPPKSEPKQTEDPFGRNGMPMAKSNVGSIPKGFLIFDQSGSNMRVMYHAVGTDVHIPSSMLEKHSKNDCCDVAQSENVVSDDESEMHEDSKEIDALLYSDDDCDYSSDDEVTSTGHSPVVDAENYEKQAECQEFTEGIASSDGPRKRQRLLDGEYIKSSHLDTGYFVKVDGSHEYSIDAESRYEIGQVELDEINSGLGNVSSKKAKILEDLRVIESIIPGAKGKDPFLVIDEAINYLKSLKDAKTLGGICHQADYLSPSSLRENYMLAFRHTASSDGGVCQKCEVS